LQHGIVWWAVRLFTVFNNNNNNNNNTYYLFICSVEQRSSWEANPFSASEEISRI
jgi:hypothetical protein